MSNWYEITTIYSKFSLDDCYIITLMSQINCEKLWYKKCKASNILQFHVNLSHTFDFKEKEKLFCIYGLNMEIFLSMNLLSNRCVMMWSNGVHFILKLAKFCVAGECTTRNGSFNSKSGLKEQHCFSKKLFIFLTRKFIYSHHL